MNEKIKLTGIYRDGYCKTEKNDFGLHTVCSIMTDEFLEFSKSVGNNLSDPVPEYNFLGFHMVIDGVYVLKDGSKHILQIKHLK